MKQKKENSLYVKVIPRASSDRIGSERLMPDGQKEWVVYVTAAPESGRANEAVLRLLAHHFDIAPSRLQVIRGHKSQHKVIKISSP